MEETTHNNTIIIIIEAEKLENSHSNIINKTHESFIYAILFQIPYNSNAQLLLVYDGLHWVYYHSFKKNIPKREPTNN